MNNPYEILGVSPNSTDDEIKEAYRKLAKKYHPDIHPDKVLAEAKMKEINYAYDTIKTLRQSGSSYQSNSNYSSSNNSYSYNNNYQAVEEYIKRRNFYTAKTILNSMNNYDSLWYYYSSIVNFNLGAIDIAKEQINIACQLEPNNINYQKIKEQMNNIYNNYKTRQTYSVNHFGLFKLIGWLFRFFLIMSFIRFMLSVMFTCFSSF
jgi:curved DNA-binding protein CbpA